MLLRHTFQIIATRSWMLDVIAVIEVVSDEFVVTKITDKLTVD